jgi:hypothetical protein
MTYTIYFELYGKKMKCRIDAYDREGAIKKLKDKIIIHKVDVEQDQTVEFLKDMFGIK